MYFYFFIYLFTYCLLCYTDCALIADCRLLQTEHEHGFYYSLLMLLNKADAVTLLESCCLLWALLSLPISIQHPDAEFASCVQFQTYRNTSRKHFWCELLISIMKQLSCGLQKHHILLYNNVALGSSCYSALHRDQLSIEQSPVWSSFDFVLIKW